MKGINHVKSMELRAVRKGLQILACMLELQVFIAHLCRRARLLNQGFQVALAQFLYLLHRSIAYKALILHLVFPETL